MGWRTRDRQSSDVRADAYPSPRHGSRRTARVLTSKMRFLVVLMAICCGCVPEVRGQSPKAAEYEVKAAFLYNFARFVEWPTSSFANTSAPLQICIFGRDPFGEALRHLTADKTVNGRKFEIDSVVDLQRARTCHMLFVSSSVVLPVKQIVENLHGTNVLTVGETKGFAEQGGIISFVSEDDRVQFEVNRKAAEQSALKISSKLLRVANLVIE